METEDIPQGKFESWAVVELLGHRKEVGYVTSRAFGPAVLFQVDCPALPEREYVLESPGYAEVEGRGNVWCPKGTKVRRSAAPAKSCLVAPGSLYAINPCSEQAAMRVIELNVARALVALELPPEHTALPPHPDDDDGSGDPYPDGDDEDD